MVAAPSSVEAKIVHAHCMNLRLFTCPRPGIFKESHVNMYELYPPACLWIGDDMSWAKPHLPLVSCDQWTKNAFNIFDLIFSWGFSGGSDGKESVHEAGDPGLIPGLERSPGEGNGNPLHCSCLENSMDKGVWWATVRGVTKSQAGLSN